MSEAAAEANETPERHATWPELFFDLVAVAGVSVVAHQLEDTQGWREIAVLAIAFIAFWIMWASVTTYGNIVGERSRLVVMLSTMALIGVMVAAVPGIYGEHARIFAIAYVVGRFVIAQPWSHVAVVVDLPIVQASIGVLPWIVSIWIEGDARYIWWAVGIAFDLFAILTRSGDRMLEQGQERLDRVRDRVAHMNERRESVGKERLRRGGPAADREVPETMTVLKGDSVHLSERMGLFVLIILGEAIIQLTSAASNSEHWGKPLFVAAVGAFAFVSMLFVMAVVRGTAGLALLPFATLQPRPLWVGHLFVSMSLVTVGAAVGRLLEEPHEPVSGHTAAMLSIGLAAYAITSAATHLQSSEARHWPLIAAVAVPLLVASALVAGATDRFSATLVAWILAAGGFAVVAIGARVTRSGAPKT